MARMVPFPMLPTTSSAERRLYEGFLEQLDDAYVVYHSVDWVFAGNEQGEADFVVAHPEDGLLVLEAKGGSLAYDSSTRRWAQGGRSGKHILGEDPFHQARDEMHSLVRILEAQPGWEEWKPSYGYGLALPDAIYERDAHPGAPAHLAIDHDDMDRLAARVRELMLGWRRPRRVFGSRGMEALSLALGYRVEIRTPLRLLFNEEDKKIVELTEDQSFIRSYVLHRIRAAVTGPAGSGKTVLAISVARHMAESGARTLLTCFNKGLAEHLSRSAESIPSLHVAHFHGLCIEMAQAAGLEIPEPATDDDSDYFEHVLPDLLERAARNLGPRFDAIIVDEAQDFRAWWWPAVLALHEDPDAGTLYLFADDAQNLYGGSGLPVSREDVLPPLQHNLRNTTEIHEFVSVFYDADGPGPGEGRGPSGRAVEVLDYRDEDELVRLVEVVLTNLVEEEDVPLGDIVVLTPAGREKSLLWARRRLGRFRLADIVEPHAVLWSTVHAFKGLERAVVILAELGERHEEDVERYVRVGASRARNHLIVIASVRVASRIRALAHVTSP